MRKMIILGFGLLVAMGLVFESTTFAAGSGTDVLLDKTRYDLGIYTLIVFGLLFLILRTVAWKPIIEGLDKREKSISDAQAEAAQARDAAKKALDEVNAKLAKAHEEAKAIVDEARRDALKLKDDLKAEAGKEIQAERDRAKREIETSRDQAMQEIVAQAVMLATSISTMTVQKNLTQSDHAALVDQAISEMKQTATA